MVTGHNFTLDLWSNHLRATNGFSSATSAADWLSKQWEKDSREAILSSLYWRKLLGKRWVCSRLPWKRQRGKANKKHTHCNSKQTLCYHQFCSGQKNGQHCQTASCSVYQQCRAALPIQEACIHFAETDTIIGGVNEKRTASESSPLVIFFMYIIPNCLQ